MNHELTRTEIKDSKNYAFLEQGVQKSLGGRGTAVGRLMLFYVHFWVPRRNRLARWGLLRQAITTKSEENWNTCRLAVRLVPQGDVFEGSDTNGAWRLATRVPRQAVWKCISPSSSGAALGIMQRQSA
ncbi:hypothetical protein DEO72_LG5g1812 [Vigna unguiculata]|uniref:Uncharacterized protein n=1 Tax=Vigna unguiculata TaxID=3917 RepID=A0A4D6M0K0_VIGUN|nr:hypothetical protein DEO72_LG5g1812 [Vigna unguiculata]